jgi:hypothetical protein
MQQPEKKLIEAALNYIDEAPLWGIDFEEETVGHALKGLHDAAAEYRKLQEEPAPYEVPGREPLATETLIWHPADQPPDADVLVLLHFGSYPDLDEEVFPAIYDGEFWYLEGGTRLVKPAIEWAHLPKGARRPGGA